jgi:peptidoglycan L-alanyl-D-glutamate endopeptidase CwlK
MANGGTPNQKSSSSPALIVAVAALVMIPIVAASIGFALSANKDIAPNPYGSMRAQPIEVGPNSPVAEVLTDFKRFTKPEEFLRTQTAVLDKLAERLREVARGIEAGDEKYASLGDKREKILNLVKDAITRIEQVKSSVVEKKPLIAKQAAQQLFANIEQINALVYPHTAVTPRPYNEIAGELHEAIRPKVQCLDKAAKEQGITIVYTEAYRSIESQNEIYQQGRTKPGPIITKAQGGQSLHNYGLAVDIMDSKKGLNLNEDVWQSLGEMGNRCGLSWGGSWNTFPDRPHFEFRNGLSITKISQMCAGYQPGKMPNEQCKSLTP